MAWVWLWEIEFLIGYHDIITFQTRTGRLPKQCCLDSVCWDLLWASNVLKLQYKKRGVSERIHLATSPKPPNPFLVGTPILTLAHKDARKWKPRITQTLEKPRTKNQQAITINIETVFPPIQYGPMLLVSAVAVFLKAGKTPQFAPHIARWAALLSEATHKCSWLWRELHFQS